MVQPANRFGPYSQRQPEGHIGSGSRVTQQLKTLLIHARTGPVQALRPPKASRFYVNPCKGFPRTAEGRLKIIQNFENLPLDEKAEVTAGPYLRAKRLLNDVSFREADPQDHTLPPPSVDPTIIHASSNTPNRRNSDLTPQNIFSVDRRRWITKIITPFPAKNPSAMTFQKPTIKMSRTSRS